MVDKAHFDWHRPPYLLVQYTPKDGVFGHEVLVDIFNRLKKESLYPVVFHDNPEMTLLEFMNFFSHPTVSLQIIVITEYGKFKDLAGIAWLSGVEEFAGKKRAVASFCAFADYQNHTHTNAMGGFVLDYWFNCLDLDIIVGMTPAANALAVRYIKRIGFSEMCRIPGYSSLLGKITDCVVTYMNKDLYGAVYGGKHGIGAEERG